MGGDTSGADSRGLARTDYRLAQPFRRRIMRSVAHGAVGQESPGQSRAERNTDENLINALLFIQKFYNKNMFFGIDDF